MSNHKKGQGQGLRRQMIPPGANILTQINPENCISMVCTICGSDIFVDAKKLHLVSALQSPIGKEGIGFTPAGYLCAGCGSLNTITKKGEEDGRKFPDHFSDNRADELRGSGGFNFGADGRGHQEDQGDPGDSKSGDSE